MLVSWCEKTGMPLHVLLTKADKLTRGPAQSTLLKLTAQLRKRLGDGVTLQTFSSLKKDGVDTLRQRLTELLLPASDHQTEETVSENN